MWVARIDINATIFVGQLTGGITDATPLVILAPACKTVSFRDAATVVGTAK
ncbi:hypothetical protein ABIC60_004831 [Phyllobacterium ifriqiyense]